MSSFYVKKFTEEKSLGERLKGLRKRQKLTLEQAEEETKVRIKYLEALERGAYRELPADVYILGFLTKYADFLGAPKEELITLYRQERGSHESPRILAPQGRINQRRAWLTPKIIVIAIVSLAIAVFLGYILYAVKNFTSPPNLEIQSPSTETVLKQDKVDVIGKTDQGATLKINDQIVFLDDKGNFKENIKLQPGLNNIEITATNRLKKETVKVVKILAEY